MSKSAKRRVYFLPSVPPGRAFQAWADFLKGWGVEPTPGSDAEVGLVEFKMPAGWPEGKAREFEAALGERLDREGGEDPLVSLFIPLFLTPREEVDDTKGNVPAALRATGERLKGWLAEVADAADRLAGHDWEVEVSEYSLDLSPPYDFRTGEQARRRLRELGVDPDVVESRHDKYDER